MNKKTKMTKKEYKIIEAMYAYGSSIEEIAESLERSVESVSKYVSKLPDPEEKTKEKKDTIVQQMMNPRKGKGITVMTPAASERLDDSRQSRQRNQSRYSKTNIHKIDGE